MRWQKNTVHRSPHFQIALGTSKTGQEWKIIKEVATFDAAQSCLAFERESPLRKAKASPGGEAQRGFCSRAGGTEFRSQTARKSIDRSVGDNATTSTAQGRDVRRYPLSSLSRSAIRIASFLGSHDIGFDSPTKSWSG